MITYILEPVIKLFFSFLNDIYSVISIFEFLKSHQSEIIFILGFSTPVAFFFDIFSLIKEKGRGRNVFTYIIMLLATIIQSIYFYQNNTLIALISTIMWLIDYVLILSIVFYYKFKNK